MNAATIANDKPARKQLSEQLDRLDSILDALSDGLNGAVADAAREGTRLAVKDAVIEIMTSPMLCAQLHQATTPEPADKPATAENQPGFWARLKAKASQTMKSVGQMAAGVAERVVGGVKAVADTAADAVRTSQGLGCLKKLIVVGLGVGVTLAVASYVAPHAVAAALSGISGAVTAAAVQIGVWTRRTVRALAVL